MFNVFVIEQPLGSRPNLLMNRNGNKKKRELLSPLFIFNKAEVASVLTAEVMTVGATKERSYNTRFISGCDDKSSFL